MCNSTRYNFSIKIQASFKDHNSLGACNLLFLFKQGTFPADIYRREIISCFTSEAAAAQGPLTFSAQEGRVQRLTLETREKRKIGALLGKNLRLSVEIQSAGAYGAIYPHDWSQSTALQVYNGITVKVMRGGTVIANHRKWQYCLKTYRQHFCFIMHSSLWFVEDEYLEEPLYIPALALHQRIAWVAALCTA